jgi:hypothetical protein
VVTAILAALGVGAAIGLLYAVLYNRFGMPSIVSTLAGLLAVLGLQLYVLGSTGSINLPYDSAIVNFGQTMVMPDWISYSLAALAGIIIFATGYRTAKRREAAGLSSRSLGGLVFQAVVVIAVLEALVHYLNLDRGVPWMFGLFEDLRQHAGNAFRIGQVDHDGYRLRAKFQAQVTQSLFGEIDERHAHTVIQKYLGAFEADARCRARNGGNFS